MCTAITYKTKNFYFGRTLDHNFSYGEEITITPRNYPIPLRHTEALKQHYAVIGTAHGRGLSAVLRRHKRKGPGDGRSEFCRKCSLPGSGYIREKCGDL